MNEKEIIERAKTKYFYIWRGSWELVEEPVYYNWIRPKFCTYCKLNDSETEVFASIYKYL